MANNTSCRAGKTIVVDPNAFDGQSSLSNVSVPLEDLSISVQLETRKKPRTVLTTSVEGSMNKSQTSKGVSVTFIEGSKTNGSGEKVLTTKYTDLTTSFDDSNESENLGITNIEIDFSSSFAPLISITFIDLRGSAVFQNEANIANGKNKYTTFFQLPYPIYDLTIKGYYGLPVKYSLHMTKFDAKFNSQTGNFEIIANFVGYTYAMLSDMLLGYLKAIPYTEEGANVYRNLRDPALGGNPDLLTLDELMTKISKIDSLNKKMQADDDDFALLNSGAKKQEDLDVIKTNIYNLGQALDINSDYDEFRFIFPKKDIDEAKAIDTYTESIKKAILVYNTNNNLIINESDFTGKAISGKKYTGLSVRLLKLSDDSDTSNQMYTEESKQRILDAKFGNPTPDELLKTRLDLIRYAKKYGFGVDAEFTVYDLRNLYQIIKTTNDDIVSEIQRVKKKLAQKFRLKVKDVLGLDPTVRNIVNVFTASVEAFMTVIYNISTSAIGVNKDIRSNQLKKFGPDETGNPNFYDIKSKSNGKSSTESGPLTTLYYPWPDYRVDDEVDGLVETYLGDPDVLDIPEDVDELRFIDDLLKAFLESAAQAAADDDALIEEQSNWVPSNPLDTRLFNDNFPYKRNSLNAKIDVIDSMLIRFFTYVGLSNRGINETELQNFAKIECASVLQDAINPSVRKSLASLTKDDFINAVAINNGEEFKVFKKDNSIYYYNYMFGVLKSNDPTKWAEANSSEIFGAHLLPIGPDPLDNNVNFYETKEAADNGKLFLTNYNTTEYSFGGSTVQKPDDGGVYIKIIKKEEYDGDKAKIIPGVTSNGQILNLETFKKKQTEFVGERESAGFDQFGGKYGIQEYRYLNFGLTGLEKAPYMAMFYENGAPEGSTYNLSNGLGLKRKEGSKTKYDLSANTLTYPPLEDYVLTENAFDYYIKEVYGDDSLHSSYGFNRALATNYIGTGSSDIVYPYVNFWVEDSSADDSNTFFGLGGEDLDLVPVSLFGSRFYYGQDNEYAKAFLFLHTFPWNGLVANKANENGVFLKNEILNTFSNRAGFIFAPKLWAAFIGGLLWRADFSSPQFIDGTTIQYSGGSGLNDPIKWKSISGVPLIPTYDVSTAVPSRQEYLTSVYDGDFPDGPMNFSSRLFGTNYKKLETILLQLPDQVKQEFKEAFFRFVSTNDVIETDWSRVKKNLQVFNGTGAQWDAAWVSLNATGGIIRDASIDKDSKISKPAMMSQYNAITNGKFVFDNYIIFSPYIMWTFEVANDTRYAYNYALELKDDCEANSFMVKLFTEEIVIANMSTKIWDIDAIPATTTNEGKTLVRENIAVKESDLNLYLDTIIANLKPADGSSVNDIEKQRKNEIFGTDNDNLIKFQLYRTCKNIYDKWVGGTESIEKLIFDGPRNGIDSFLAKKSRGDKAQPTLIDSFRFVTRSFRDIGDEMVINPTPVYDFLHDNPNASFYDSVTSLLSANNFDFIALPNYINYGDEESLQSMFKPMTSADGFKNGTTGPSFVCVYVGQTSKHLDFRDSEYTNDGVDFQCDSNGGLMPTPAKDFTSTSGEDYENKVAVFAVNYSQQNQNIFKDISLNQSEFTETAESLQITDNIANKGDKNSKTFGGQNIFNVYSVRSYKTEVEMMGNAMIQPMMYFQLNNIPMFHGAYMITHVKHSIKPNTMSTHFTGVRIRNVETRLMDVSELFMSLLDSVESTNTKDPKQNFGTGSALYEQDAIPDSSVANLFGNPYELGNAKSIINSAPGVRSLDGTVRNHAGVDFSVVQGTNLLAVADGTVEWLKYNFKDGVGYGLYMVINHDVLGVEKKTYKSVYGHISELDAKIMGKTVGQLTPTEITKILGGINPGTKVTKGQVIGKSGGIKNRNYLQQSPLRYDLAGGSTGAHLHYELHIGTEKEINSSFSSIQYVNPVPYFPLGVTAVYKNGNTPNPISNSVDTILGNNADFWSLVSICSLEAGNPQARADVAQSLYNRLATPKQPYGKSLKEIIVAKNQYEPTFNNRNDWKLINDETSAVKAVATAKGWTNAQARTAIKETNIAIADKTLQKNSVDFIGTRTEFLAAKPNSSKAVDVVERQPSAQNNAFYWEYAGIALKDKPVPLAINWTTLKVNTNMA